MRIPYGDCFSRTGNLSLIAIVRDVSDQGHSPESRGVLMSRLDKSSNFALPSEHVMSLELEPDRQSLLLKINQLHIHCIPEDVDRLQQVDLVSGGVVDAQLSAFDQVEHRAIGDGLHSGYISVVRWNHQVAVVGVQDGDASALLSSGSCGN